MVLATEKGDIPANTGTIADMVNTAATCIRCMLFEMEFVIKFREAISSFLNCVLVTMIRNSV